jgi:hypothetical protein
VAGLGEDYSEYEDLDLEIAEGYNSTLYNSGDISLENRGKSHSYTVISLPVLFKNNISHPFYCSSSLLIFCLLC